MVGLQQICHLGRESLIVGGVKDFYFTFHEISLTIHMSLLDREHDALDICQLRILFNVYRE